MKLHIILHPTVKKQKRNNENKLLPRSRFFQHTIYFYKIYEDGNTGSVLTQIYYVVSRSEMWLRRVRT